MMIERYWLFAAMCLVSGLFVLRLVFRERLTLQSSLAYFGFLGGLGVLALFPSIGAYVGEAMGFTLVSNFLFAASLVGLAILHLAALMAISRIELRTVALVQEVAMLRAELEQKSAAPSESTTQT